MTILVLGPVIESDLLIRSGPPPASRLASVCAGEDRGEVISVLVGSLIASRSVHCVALQTPLPDRPGC